MKKLIAALLCSAALAAATPVSISYVNPGTPGVVDTDSNDYVGPYTLKVSGHNVPAMCMDDFYNTSGSWSANVTLANSADLSNTYLGNTTFNLGGTKVASSQVYQLEAYLFSEILKPGSDRIDIQDAAWTLMDYVTGHTPHSSPENSAVDSIIGDAATNFSTFDASRYEILSQVNPGSHAEQEFMVVATPEPASCALMGGALLLLGMTRMWSQKRNRSTIAE